MSKIKIIDSEASLTNQDIIDFENTMSIELPQNFKKFIAKYNGGLVEDHDDVDTFNSIKYGSNTIEKFIEIHQRIEKNLSDSYLPIAGDWSDNPITVCLNGEDEGKIVKFYFDSDQEPEIIADSLEDLLGVESIDDL